MKTVINLSILANDAFIYLSMVEMLIVGFFKIFKEGIEKRADQSGNTDIPRILKK